MRSKLENLKKVLITADEFLEGTTEGAVDPLAKILAAVQRILLDFLMNEALSE